jgi:TRAP-type C4-dicarboxylate transport system permease small subunit
MLAPNDLRSFRNVVIPSIAILLVLIIAAAAWTYTTRDWNASGTHKAGSPSGSTPSEGGEPLILNK